MVFESFRRGGPSLEKMVGDVAEMLGHARHIFDAATNALLAGASPEAVADDVFGTDRRINELEREVRRELIVHTSIRGTSDITGVLIVLMVSRKVERIGDNAKNIYDLAATSGVNLIVGEDIEELRQARDVVSQMMFDAASIFRDENAEAAEPYLEHSRELQRVYDDAMMALIGSDMTASQAVPRALYYRYLKRIVANLEGVVAGVVQPLDLIDYSPDGTEESET